MTSGSYEIYIEKRNKEEEGRDARKNCGWDGASERRGKPSAMWAPLLGDTARGGGNA